MHLVAEVVSAQSPADRGRDSGLVADLYIDYQYSSEWHHHCFSEMRTDMPVPTDEWSLF